MFIHSLIEVEAFRVSEFLRKFHVSRILSQHLSHRVSILRSIILMRKKHWRCSSMIVGAGEYEPKDGREELLLLQN